jgi:two-component system response regulator DesR
MIHAIIAESVPLIRAGLTGHLATERDIEVVAELDRAEQVVPRSRLLCPQVAVLGSLLGDRDIFDVALELHGTVPSCHALIMAQSRNPCDVRRAAQAHAAGIVGRDAAPELFAKAIRQVAKGTRVVDPDLAFAALSMAENPLTPREIDALRYAAEGATSAEIARVLCLSVGTVRNYVSRAIAKTGGRNRVDAIRIAEGAGWL